MIKNRYGFWKSVQMGFWLLRSKAINRNIRLIRFPIDLRGKRYIDFGTGLTTGVGCRLEAFSETGQQVLHFGKHVQINDYVHICAMKKVTIGDHVLMAGHIYISDNSHGSYKGGRSDSSPDTPPTKRDYLCSEVVIEDNVWLGEHVVVLPGVTIGKGSVIGANSVVSKDVPPGTIAAGAPAKIIKQYNHQQKKWIKS